MARPVLSRLDERKLVVVAGKGGVGKTTTSCAIALELAASGKRTLVVTVDPAKRLEDALGVPVGFAATRVRPGLDAMMLDPETVIRDHMAERVPEAQVTQHPLFRQVAKALPGLNELVAIGKLNDIRREGNYDAIVVDTAPTGHALSFLGAPKMVEEVLKDGSLVRWAVRGYAVWQKLYGTARNVQNLFRSKAQEKPAAPDIDFERLFADMQAEARRIRTFLTDPDHSSLVLVTLPEKLPVEETCDLYADVTKELGMRVHAIVVNKVQPDPLEGHAREVAALSGTAARKRFVAAAGAATGQSPVLFERLLDAAAFNQARRAMNLRYIEDLRKRLPKVPTVEVPLFVSDVEGLVGLEKLRAALFVK